MKELQKTIYLLYVKCLYQFCTLKVRQKNNSVLFISTFENNNLTLKQNFALNAYDVIEINPNKMTIKSQLMAIKQAKIIIIDNYYYPLATLNLDGKQVIQIWHAPGAIKKFGLASPKNNQLANSAIKRFKRVYNGFDKIVVGSDQMQKVMQEAFAITDDSKFIKSGFVKSDQLYAKNFNQKSIAVMNSDKYSKEKPYILYLPTFRDEDRDNLKQIELIKEIADKCTDFQLFYHLHPSIKAKNTFNIPNAIEINTSDIIYFYPNCELVITDYSSVVFDSAVFNTPCAFYVYDYEKYVKNQGLFIKKEQMPGYVTTELSDLLKYINTKNFSESLISEFDLKYNKYNSANSGYNLVKMILNKEGE